MDVRVSGLRGVDFAVFDLEASAGFYADVWALQEVGREAGVVSFRAAGGEHHVLTLRQQPRAGLLAVNFAAADKTAVDALYAKAAAMGAEVRSAPAALATSGGGYGFALISPEGQGVTISSNVAQHADRLENRAAPSKLTHVVLNSENTDSQMRFFVDMLGFRLSDVSDAMNFIRCSRDHHAIALAKSNGPSLNHIAYEMESIDALMRGAGRVRMKGFEMGWGVGRHAGPGANIFSYFIDPNGFATEYTTDVEQVDDNYQVHYPEHWRNVPIRPCAWGMAMNPTKEIRHAMSGNLLAERNQACDAAISRALSE